MKDLTILLEDRPGTLADMGEALGRAGVSVEGGGAWIVGGTGVAHFLVTDADTARRALAGTCIQVLAERDVIALRLKRRPSGGAPRAWSDSSRAGPPASARSAKARRWI